MSNNGKDLPKPDERQPTEEEKLEQKKKAFEERPDEFLHMSELIVAAKPSEVVGRVEVFVNRSSARNYLLLSEGEINRAVNRELTLRELKETAVKSKIIQSKGSMVNWARGGMKGK